MPPVLDRLHQDPLDVLLHPLNAVVAVAAAAAAQSAAAAAALRAQGDSVHKQEDLQTPKK